MFRGEIDEARRFEELLQQCLDRNELEYLYMRPLAVRTLLLVQEDRPEEAIRVALEGIALARKKGPMVLVRGRRWAIVRKNSKLWRFF